MKRILIAFVQVFNQGKLVEYGDRCTGNLALCRLSYSGELCVWVTRINYLTSRRDIVVDGRSFFGRSFLEIDGVHTSIVDALYPAVLAGSNTI